MSLDTHRRYVQIAFNGDARQARSIIPSIPRDPRIILEAGTPYVKREGMNGVRLIRRMWPGIVVADIKVTDGAIGEVNFSAAAGANAATVMGSAPVETLDFFCEYCAKRGIYSMIDMLGVEKPLRKLMPLRHKPDVIVIHKGRDEETNRRKLIRYRNISRVRSKFDSLISVAGGLVPEKVREAYFNGADIAVLNVVRPHDHNAGIPQNANFNKIISDVLKEIGN